MSLAFPPSKPASNGMLDRIRLPLATSPLIGQPLRYSRDNALSARDDCQLTAGCPVELRNQRYVFSPHKPPIVASNPLQGEHIPPNYLTNGVPVGRSQTPGLLKQSGGSVRAPLNNMKNENLIGRPISMELRPRSPEAVEPVCVSRKTSNELAGGSLPPVYSERTSVSSSPVKSAQRSLSGQQVYQYISKRPGLSIAAVQRLNGTSCIQTKAPSYSCTTEEVSSDGPVVPPPSPLPEEITQGTTPRKKVKKIKKNVLPTRKPAPKTSPEENSPPCRRKRHSISSCTYGPTRLESEVGPKLTPRSQQRVPKKKLRKRLGSPRKDKIEWLQKDVEIFDNKLMHTATTTTVPDNVGEPSKRSVKRKSSPEKVIRSRHGGLRSSPRGTTVKQLHKQPSTAEHNQLTALNNPVVLEKSPLKTRSTLHSHQEKAKSNSTSAHQPTTRKCSASPQVAQTSTEPAVQKDSSNAAKPNVNSPPVSTAPAYPQPAFPSHGIWLDASIVQRLVVGLETLNTKLTVLESNVATKPRRRVSVDVSGTSSDGSALASMKRHDHRHHQPSPARSSTRRYVSLPHRSSGRDMRGFRGPEQLSDGRYRPRSNTDSSGESDINEILLQLTQQLTQLSDRQRRLKTVESYHCYRQDESRLPKRDSQFETYSHYRFPGSNEKNRESLHPRYVSNEPHGAYDTMQHRKPEWQRGVSTPLPIRSGLDQAGALRPRWMDFKDIRKYNEASFDAASQAQQGIQREVVEPRVQQELLYSLQIESLDGGASSRVVDVVRIHTSPEVLIVMDLLTPAECLSIQAMKQGQHEECVSLLGNVRRRIAALLQVNAETVVNLQIVSRSPEEPSYIRPVCSVGTTEILIFLNDIEEGGTVDFSMLGLTVRSRAGTAVAWRAHSRDDGEKLKGVAFIAPGSQAYILTCTATAPELCDLDVMTRNSSFPRRHVTTSLLETGRQPYTRNYSEVDSQKLKKLLQLHHALREQNEQLSGRPLRAPLEAVREDDVLEETNCY